MTIDGGWAIFGIGCAGGALAEVFHWWNLRQEAQFPDYVKSAFYWGITAAMILAGGLIAWLYFGEHAEGMVVMHVGISTPLILQKLATSVPERPGAKNIIVNPSATIRRFFTW